MHHLKRMRNDLSDDPVAERIHLIYFSYADWATDDLRAAQHIAKELSVYCTVTYVAPQQTLARTWPRLPSRASRIEEDVSPSLKVIRPRNALSYLGALVPGPVRPKLFEATAWLNAKILTRMMRPRLEIPHPGRRTVGWFTDPAQYYLLSCLPWDVTCLFSYDDPSGLLRYRSIRSVIADLEARMAAKVDLVIASSRQRQQRLHAYNPNSYFVPNGVDLHHFQSVAVATSDVPPEMQGETAILGYVGHINWRMNFEILSALALRFPKARVVLVGPAETPRDQAALHQLSASNPNVEWLGPRHVMDLPAYVRSIDVCLIPFKVTPETQTMLPLKLFEYLAVGRPVVATALPELFPFSQTIAIARTCEDFCKLVSLELEKDPKQGVRSRQAIAARFGWPAIAERVWQLIGQHLRRSPRRSRFASQDGGSPGW